LVRNEATWSRNSIANLCKCLAKEQKADDVRKTLEVFKEMKKQDPGFKCSVDYDAKNKIKTLMWCTGNSRRLMVPGYNPTGDFYYTQNCLPYQPISSSALFHNQKPLPVEFRFGAAKQEQYEETQDK